MAKCAGKTGAGECCGAIAISGSDYCHAHHPDRAEARRRAASKGGKRGGRGRPQAELAGIKARLSDLAEDVLEGKADKGAAAVAGQLLNTYIRAVGMELKAKEGTELEERIAALEQQQHGGEGRPPWVS